MLEMGVYLYIGLVNFLPKKYGDMDINLNTGAWIHYDIYNKLEKKI